MSHTLSTKSESSTGVTFECSTCGAVCEFVKPGQGEPAAVQDLAGTWLPPANPETWMGPCNA